MRGVKFSKFDKYGYEIKGWEYLSNHFWRFLSIPLARLLSKTRIRPEQIVLSSFVLGVSSAFLFASDLRYAVQLGALAFVLFWLLDFTDGDLARMKSQTSHFGDWLDSLCGKIVTPVVYAGICVNCARSNNPVVIWAMGYSILSAYYIFGMAEKKTLSIKQKMSASGPVYSPGGAVLKKSLLKAFVHEITNGHNILYYFLILGAFLNQLYIALVVSAIYAWGITFLTMYLNYKEIKRLEIK